MGEKRFLTKFRAFPQEIQYVVTSRRSKRKNEKEETVLTIS